MNCHNRMVMVFKNGMSEVLVPIDQAGRIVLPKKVRQELAIKAGDRFRVLIRGGEVTLRPDREPVGLVRKGKALVFCSSSNEPLHQETVNELLESERQGILKETAQWLDASRRRK